MYISQKKRGRPQQHRPAIDLGTKELQQKRAILLGKGPIQNPALAESLLGVFYGQDLISTPLYEAGVCFGELGYRYEPCLGQKFRHSSSLLIYKKIGSYGYSPDLWSDKCHKQRTMAWGKALLALKQAGRGPYRTVMEVVFYGQDLYLTPFSKRMIAIAQPLRMGLASLDVYFKGATRGRRDNRPDLGLNPGRSTIFQPASEECRSDGLA